MPRINITLSESQKEDWDAFAEDNPRVDSVADLVRTAVTEYIANEGDSSRGGLNDEVAEDIMTAVDAIEEMKERQLQIEDQLKAARTEIPSEDEIDAIVHNGLGEYIPEILQWYEDQVDFTVQVDEGGDADYELRDRRGDDE